VPAVPVPVVQTVVVPQPYPVLHPYPVRPVERVTMVKETRSRAVEVKYTRTRVIRHRWQ
jgi:hypothetical protein